MKISMWPAPSPPEVSLVNVPAVWPYGRGWMWPLIQCPHWLHLVFPDIWIGGDHPSCLYCTSLFICLSVSLPLFPCKFCFPVLASGFPCGENTAGSRPVPPAVGGPNQTTLPGWPEGNPPCQKKKKKPPLSPLYDQKYICICTWCLLI